MGFYIKPDVTPARIALGITSVLVVIINLQSLLRVLPPTAIPPTVAPSCALEIERTQRLVRPSHSLTWEGG